MLSQTNSWTYYTHGHTHTDMWVLSDCEEVGNSTLQLPTTSQHSPT